MSGLPGDTAGTEARLAGESGEPAAAAPHENEQVHQALVSPAAEGASASGPLQRVWQGLATAGIWTGRALIAAVAVLTLIDIGQEWKQNEVIIDPVLVPEAVAKAGWTSEVLAGQIKDDIGRIDEAGRTDYPHALYGLRSKSEDPDFTVAGGTISARAFARWIHKVVAGPPRRLVGEVIALDEKDIGSSFCSDDSTRYALHARLEPSGSSWTVCAATLADLMQKASERTLRQTDPYRLALYFGRRQHPAPASTDDLNRIREIADEMLRSGAADQTEWALNLSGLVHDRSGRDHLKESRADQAKAEFNLALRDFELAYRLNPDFSPAHINRGWALLHLGDRQASIEEFRKSIDVHKARGIPPYLDSYIGLGFAYLDLQDAENAIANLKTAKCVEPNYVDPRNEDDAYAGLIKAFQLKTDSKAKDKVIKLRECLKDGRRYDLCRLQTEDDSERSGSASSNGLTMCD